MGVIVTQNKNIEFGETIFYYKIEKLMVSVSFGGVILAYKASHLIRKSLF